MDGEALENCIGPLSNTYLSRLPHHIPPCVNLRRIVPCEDDVNDIADLLENPFPYTSTVPVPLLPLVPASFKVLNGYDSTKTLVKKKLRWQLKKERLVDAVRKDKKNISGKAIKRAVRVPLDGKAIVPRGVAMLGQHLDKDPDPGFSGTYNWYYTGGKLATLEQQDDHYLLHANKSELNYTKIVNQEKSGTSVVQFDPDEPIYQVISRLNKVAVRQRTHVDILSVSDGSEEGLKLTKVSSISEKNHPFLSVALPPDSVEQYCTVTTTGSLKLWDLEYSRKKPKVKVRSIPGEGITVSDNWRTMMYQDPNTLLMADRCCVHVLDIRTELREKQLAWCMQKLSERCEEMSYMMGSRAHDQSIYTLTTHQAFSLDLRFGFCQRWTHMMASPPLMGFTQHIDNKNMEVLCVGSSVLSDCVVMVNHWSGEEPQSRWRPASLPSPSHGLQLARLHGTCLDPTLDQRCTQSMTGLTWLPSMEGLCVIRQSATADVFIQHLSSGDSNDKHLTEKEIASYADWSKPTLSLQREPEHLTVRPVKDCTSLFKALTSKSVPEEIKTEAGNTGTAWKVSKKYLEDCVDMLAGRMLAVWDVQDEEEWEEVKDAEVEPEDKEQDPAEKVLNWLGSANDTAGRKTTDIAALKPSVTSTPFPTQTPAIEDKNEPSPFMIQPSGKYLQTPAPKKKMTPPAYGHFLSSSSSEGSPKAKQKKLEKFDHIEQATPTKSLALKKPSTTSAKKKFIPGF